MQNLFKKIVRTILLTPVLLILLFEEWGWAPLARCFAALGRLPWWSQLERLITLLPPWAALLAFGLPAASLIPVKLLALYLFGQGHMVFGLTLVLAAKLAGTALAARLFQLTEPALMRMPWFARLYRPWKIWKNNALARVRNSAPWRMAGSLKRRLKFLAGRVMAACKAAIS